MRSGRRSGLLSTVYCLLSTACRVPTVHVFSTDAPPDQIAELERLLTPAELERAGRFHFEADCVRFVASRGRLRILLGESLGMPPETITFSHGIHGKPVVSGRPDGIEFSLSRS